MMHAHVLHGPADHPLTGDYADSCQVCRGGLSLCKVCGGAEASMPTECPGRMMAPHEADSVQAERLDFRCGEWVAIPRIVLEKKYQLSAFWAFMKTQKIEAGTVKGVIYTKSGVLISDSATWNSTTGKLISYEPIKGAADGFAASDFNLAWARLSPALAGDRTAADILAEMSATYRERNAAYGSSYKKIPEVMSRLFPEGVALRDADNFLVWHLFGMIVAKVVRFANSELTHLDSIHDIGCYAAMLQRELENKLPPITAPVSSDE